MKNISQKVPVFFLTVLLFFAALLAPAGGGKASAASGLADPPSSIAETNVLDDLEGSTLNGKIFNKDDFAQSDIRDPQIISLAEYGYSFYASRQDDYGLYVYIYNPRVQVFDNNPARNQIQIKAGELASDKYNLQFLNYSTEVGYEGLFYKYKVLLTDTEKDKILSSLRRTERIYEVTEFELSINGALASYTCATKYTYKGFAQGYGSELAADESTLTCAVDGFEDYIELDVHQTVYRPQGDFYEGEQSQLNSCYFRVPEKFFTNYGDLCKIVCEWYEYITQPILITEDLQLYKYIHQLYGANATSLQSPYFLLAGLTNDPGGLYARQVSKFISNYPTIDEIYNGMVNLEHALYGGIEFPPTARFDNFAAVFSSENKPYDSYTVTKERLIAEFLQNSQRLGGTMLAGQYSEKLFFDDITAGHTRGYNKKEITPDEERPIFWNYTTKKFWQKIFGGYYVDTIYEDIKAIITITNEDLQGNDAEIASKLYIDEKDVADIKREYNIAQNTEHKDKERLILLRYSSGTYTAMPCVSTIQPKNDDNALAYDLWIKLQTGQLNGYMAQETVFLDFDIISLWFRTEDAETEIPVAMTPQDVFSNVTPPLTENYRTDGGLPDWALWLIVVVLGVLLIVVLVLFFPVLRPILAAVLKVLWWIISAPFRFIAWIIKKIAAAVKKRKEAKAAAPPEPPAPPEPSKPKSGPEKGKGEKAQQEPRIVLEIQTAKSTAIKRRKK